MLNRLSLAACGSAQLTACVQLSRPAMRCTCVPTAMPVSHSCHLHEQMRTPRQRPGSRTSWDVSAVALINDVATCASRSAFCFEKVTSIDRPG